MNPNILIDFCIDSFEKFITNCHIKINNHNYLEIQLHSTHIRSYSMSFIQIARLLLLIASLLIKTELYTILVKDCHNSGFYQSESLMCSCPAQFIGPLCQYPFRQLISKFPDRVSFTDPVMINSSKPYQLFAIYREQATSYQIVTKICFSELDYDHPFTNIYVTFFLQDSEGYLIEKSQGAIQIKNTEQVKTGDERCELLQSRQLNFHQKRNQQSMRYVIMVSSNNRSLTQQNGYQTAQKLVYSISAQKISAEQIFNQGFTQITFAIIGSCIVTAILMFFAYYLFKKCKQKRTLVSIQPVSKNYQIMAPVATLTKQQTQSREYSNMNMLPGNFRSQAIESQLGSKIIQLKISEDSLSNLRECVICMELLQVNQQVRKGRCGHTYHRKCLDEWVKRTMSCPTCRKDFSRSQVRQFPKLFKQNQACRGN